MYTIPTIKCKNCNKEYNRQSAYDKHKLRCIGGAVATLTPQTPQTTLNVCEDKRSDCIEGAVATLTPQTPQPQTTLNICGGLGGLPLRDIVMELVKSNQKLRKDVEELKKYMQAKKKKINIVDWLNENYKPAVNYKEFISKLCITRSHLEIVFKSNIIDGIQEILEEFMSNQEKNENNPFKSFDIRDNVIYVYNEESKWEILSSTEYTNMISIISKNIMTEFKKWQDENEHQLYAEDFSVIYVQNVKKVMGGDMPIDKQRGKIHRNLYKYLKMNLQNTVEYAFL
jgi:hypothetical protein